MILSSFRDPSSAIDVLGHDKVPPGLPFHDDPILIVILVIFLINVRYDHHRSMLPFADRSLVVQNARLPCGRTRFLTSLIPTLAADRTLRCRRLTLTFANPDLVSSTGEERKLLPVEATAPQDCSLAAVDGARNLACANP